MALTRSRQIHILNCPLRFSFLMSLSIMNFSTLFINESNYRKFVYLAIRFKANWFKMTMNLVISEGWWKQLNL